MSMQDQLPPSEDPVSRPAPAPSSYDTPAGPTANDKTMGMLSHLLGIFLGPIGPLIIWLTQKDTAPWAGDEAKSALNFQITALIASLAIFVLSIVTLGLGSLLFFPLGLVILIFEVMGAIEANKGVHYKYPFSLKLIS